MDRYPWKIDLHEVSPAARVLVSSAEHAYIKASGCDWSGLGEFSEWRYIVNMMAERIAELEPYHLACRKIQQWIGCEDQEVDEAVVRRVEGDANKIAALEAREAELESALRLILEEVDDPSRGSIHLSKPARDAARKALAKARGEVSDA